MNPGRMTSLGRRAVYALLPLVSAAVAVAAEEGGAHGGGGIPWGEVLKQAINLAILAGVLGYFLRKPVSSFLAQRSELLRKSIEDAADARKEAAEKLSAVEVRMAKLSDEIAQMNARMDAEAGAEVEKIRKAYAAEIAGIQAQAEFAGQQELKKAREELRREASELATRAAEELVRRTLTPEDQERLVRENIQKIEAIVR